MLTLITLNWNKIWVLPHGSWQLFVVLFLAFAIPSAFLYAVKSASPLVRNTLVASAFFFSGLIYVLYFLWPQPINRQPGQIPANFSESVSFFIGDTIPVVADVANVISAFLLGLGVFSVLTIHITKVRKRHKEAAFSIALLISIVLMAGLGFWNYYQTLNSNGVNLGLRHNWGMVQYSRDFLFDGLLQQMDAAMFSLIAFYILSAAYRAFRIRSIEATVLLGTALILMLSVMGILANPWSEFLKGTHSSFATNFDLATISQFLQNSFQSSSIRAVDFGVGIGTLAMALRLWLSIDRQSMS